MKFTPIAALVMSSLAAFAQSASAQTGAEGRMNFLRDSRAATSGPQFEFSRLQYGPLPIAGTRVASSCRTQFTMLSLLLMVASVT